MNKKYIFFLLFFPYFLYSQIGGQHTFAFINTETSPRVIAVGGGIFSALNDDVSLCQNTPSLLNQEMSGNLVLNYSNHFSNVNIVSAHYAQSISRIGIVSLALNSINYGDFISRDEVGNQLGVFSANDQIIILGIGRNLNNHLLLGINFKILNSIYENYSSLGIASNISTTYTNKGFTATFLARNIGRQLNSYTSTQENIPFELQIGISQELKYLPFRYFITIHHLNKFDISNNFFPEITTDPITQDLILKKESFGKKVLRHFIIGGELNPFKRRFFLRGGLDFQRRFDMLLSTKPLMVGFSWGIGVKISKFEFNYSQSLYHLDGVTNNFSIATNLSNFGLIK